MTRVKICGCMRVADAVAAAEAGADFIGIIFAESRRRVSPEEAALIARAVGAPLRELEQDEPPPLHPGRFETIEAWFAHGAEALDRLLARKRPLVVGVFADQPAEEINEIADEVGLDLVQLSGSEPWSDCLAANRQAIKVLPPRAGMTAGEIMAHIEPETALAFMLDPSRGTGTAGDRGVAAAVAARVPLWLAGGLDAANVAATIASVRPWAVDVSSGVETDGAKDARKIASFVAAVRDADSALRTRTKRGPRTDLGPRTDRSSDLSPPRGTTKPSDPSSRGTDGSSDLSPRGSRMASRISEPRRSSPRLVGFPHRGGHRYHLVFSTNDNRPHLRQSWAALAVSELHGVAAATGFTLEAYCVMPDHVHVLVAGDGALDSSLTAFSHRFKQALGYRFKRATGKPLWHRSYYDHVVRTGEPVLSHVAYIVANPVVAGLVDAPEDWPHSGPQEALEEVAGALGDRSEDLSVRSHAEALAREFGDHLAGHRQ